MSTMLETAMPGSPVSSAMATADLQPMLAGALTVWLQQQGDLLLVKELPAGRWVHANEAWAGFLQRPLRDLSGLTDADVFDPALATALRAAEQTALAQNEPLASEHRFDWAGQRQAFSVLRVVLGPDAAGRRWLAAVWHDLSADQEREAQLKAALEQIEQQQRANDLLRRELADQALRDPATGLHRRAHFDDQLRREVDLSTREHREFAIVFMALDPPGDKLLALGAGGEQAVLEAMGRLLRGGTRAMDASCRVEERRFAVLLSGVGLATAHARMEGLRRKCATQIVVHQGQEFGFTVAMGVASFPHTAQTQEALVLACEAALAEAQKRGGNHVTLAAIRLES
jgi:diguanylate cyclase (GGDEF)-like protein